MLWRALWILSIVLSSGRDGWSAHPAKIKDVIHVLGKSERWPVNAKKETPTL